STTSRMTVPPSPSSSNRCSCHQRRNGPAPGSSTTRAGASQALITDVIRQVTPKRRARHVTSSPRPIRPDVTPPTARSPDALMDATWTSTDSDSSKTLRGSARTAVTTSIRTTPHILLRRDHALTVGGRPGGCAPRQGPSPGTRERPGAGPGLSITSSLLGLGRLWADRVHRGVALRRGLRREGGLV